MNLCEVGVDQLQDAMNQGELSAAEITHYYLQQIASHNYGDANLHAFITVQDAELLMEQAHQLDRERQQGKARGPLHGIPVAIKDNIDTGDGMPTTTGSLLLREHRAPDDAFVVKQLRDAGAIILGKTNLSEWANFRSTASSSGWSSLGGQTKNPYDPTRSTCGSSSGSAVAVSANLVTLAIGTETDGSLTMPASTTGIVAIKPTRGLISRDGIIPIARSQDTAGPMARSVRDAVYMLQVMAGNDQRDDDSYSDDRDFTDYLSEQGLQGKRIGVVRELTGYHAGVDALFDQQLPLLEQAGATLVDALRFPSGLSWARDEFDLLLHEFRQDIADYLAQTSDTGFNSLKDLILANSKYKDAILPWFGQEMFILAEGLSEESQQDYEAAVKRAKQAAGHDTIDALLKKHELDLLIAPTSGPAWKIDLINGDNLLGSASSAPAVAGYPHITVPMGFVHEMPVGLSFIGTARSEATLIAAAYAYEQCSSARRAPDLTCKTEPDE
ncbi:amidase [Pseudidiomarina salinarum]|uniref:amidase n=1 Tax=Pseudidiomarina salinarum TaxID=435908 RepID=UPI000691C941|nr:amidase [Pseudidiomarina salinarum]RUO69963.1 amidase [Pseudidiomarina salinarum]